MPKTYGTVTTFTAGSVLTAAQLNTASTAINNLVVPAAVSVYTTAATVSIANATFTRLSFTTANHDTDSMKGAGTVTGLTINTTGLYLLTTYGVFDANATGSRALYIDKGTGTSITTIIGFGLGLPQNANYSDVVATACVPLTAGDTIQVFAWQNSGGALNMLGNGTNKAFTATWIGRTS